MSVAQSVCLAAGSAVRRLARPMLVCSAAMLLGMAALPAAAQIGIAPRHETNANRQRRIAREIKDTYTHRWEFGGGGGYLRFRSGEALQRNSEIGFWVNGTYYLNEKLGITGELRGDYGNAKLYNTASSYGITYRPQISEYPYLGGVTYRVYTKERYGVSVFGLGGAAIGKFEGDTKLISGNVLGLWPSSNARPAFSAGANVDINIYPNLAFRFAPSYNATTFGGSYQSNLGIDIGLVYRLGRQ